jgi:hypothetical protein
MFRFNQTANDGEFEVKEEHREKIKLKDKQSMEKAERSHDDRIASQTETEESCVEIISTILVLIYYTNPPDCFAAQTLLAKLKFLELISYLKFYFFLLFSAMSSIITPHAKALQF